MPELDVRLVFLIDELDHQSLVEEGLDLEPFGDQGGVVIQVLEDVRIGRVGDGRAGPPRWLSLLDGALGLAAAVALNVSLAVTPHLGDQALAQRR